MNLILTLLGGKFGAIIAIALAAVFAALLSAIGVLWWRNDSLTDQLIEAKATERMAVAANAQWAEQAGRINGKVDALIAREAQSATEVTAALARVSASATRLVVSARELVERPLPADASQDCKTVEAELRALLRERRTN